MNKRMDELEEKCSKLFKDIKQIEKQLETKKSEYKRLQSELQIIKLEKRDADNRSKIRTTNESLQNDWIEPEFSWTKNLRQHLKDIFKFDDFRPKQLAAINATLSRKDVLLVMPTGGGKSLVYQLPTLVEKGFTLVVSPLLSLIEDQLIGLQKIGIEAESINSATPKNKTKEIYEKMLNKKLKLLYVTPEWLAKSKRFMSQLKKSYEANLINRVAIDEVHCCSTWGHDFRPEYGYLGILRPILAKVPFLGLTATATMSVLSDVQTMLTLEDCMIITAPFNRPNLYYRVINKPSTKDAVLDCLVKYLTVDYKNQSGIIYTTTINDSVNLASDLRNNGVKVAPYHAQLEPDQKRSIHRKWLDQTYQVVVATVAFGMGIDKPDVRFVIHHSVPKSMESLYQESGRAGRDGARADCILLFSLNDFFRVISMVGSVTDEKKAYSVLNYCLDQTSCRRALLATHFDETWNEDDCNRMCDHCNGDRIHYTYDIASACCAIHSIIENADNQDEKLTLNKLLDSWFQTSTKKLRVSNLDKPKFDRQQAEYIVSYLLSNRYLGIDKGYNTYSTICYLQKGKKCNGEKIEIVCVEKMAGLKTVNDENGPVRKKVKLK